MLPKYAESFANLPGGKDLFQQEQLVARTREKPARKLQLQFAKGNSLCLSGDVFSCNTQLSPEIAKLPMLELARSGKVLWRFGDHLEAER